MPTTTNIQRSVGNTGGQGTALLTALFLMVIIVVITTAITVRLHLDINNTERLLDRDKCYLGLQGAQYWALGLFKQQTDHKLQHFGPLPYNEFAISGELIDAQSLFNLNNLLDKEQNKKFSTLMRTIIPNWDKNALTHLIDTLNYWLNSNHENLSLEEHYLSRSYSISHLPMQSISELLLIQEFPRESYNLIFPYITILPGKTAININSAPLPVLMTLGAGLTREQSEMIIKERESIQGFSSLSQCLENKLIKELNIPSTEITVSSRYYLLHAIASKKNYTIELYTLLEKIPLENQIQAHIIWQRLNIL